MKYLSVKDVECIVFFRVFNSKQDKIEFIEYLFYYRLISERTKKILLEEFK